MRANLIIFCAAAAAFGAPVPASAQSAPPSWTALEQSVDRSRGGFPVAEFSVDGRQVSVNAYGRRMRARALDATDALHRARIDRKIYDGAPSPSLVTLEVSLSF